MWNARAAGHDAEQVVDVLESYSRFPVPKPCLSMSPKPCPATAASASTLTRPTASSSSPMSRPSWKNSPAVLPENSSALASTRTPSPSRPPSAAALNKPSKAGWPAEDLAGYVDGESHPIALNHDGWQLRDYQQYATEAFWSGGSGVVVLPCGAGKTIVGAAAMAKAESTTLILVTNTVAGRQWRDELLRRTTLTENEIGEYSGEKKEIKPITIATYQVVTRKTKGEYRALELFDSRDWGLIIYDEVHLLPPRCSA